MVISKTQKYIINLEVKHALSLTKHKQKDGTDKSTIESALEQVEGAKRLVVDYFSGDLTDEWRFIGAVYTESVAPDVTIGADSSNYVMVGEASILHVKGFKNACCFPYLVCFHPGFYHY